ncbi:MAG: hypothetical protein GWP36_05025 [Bacteroidetes bacterium]|nr:hypothetical protein [Bacteroidota bacterium]
MSFRPLYISLGCHLAFAVLIGLGLPMFGRDIPEEMPIVRMEVVRTVPETNVIEGDKPSTAKEEQKATVRKKPPPPPPPPPPSPARSTPTPPLPKPEAPAKAQETAKIEDKSAEALPEKPKKVQKLAKIQLPTPKPKRKPAAPKKAVPKPAPPIPAPKPKSVSNPVPKPKSPTRSKANEALTSELNKLAKQKKKREDAASGVLQNLAKAQVAAEDAEKARKTQERKEAADTVNKTLSAVAGNAVKAPPKKSLSPVGIDDIARIQQHVSRCWQPPLGAAGNDTLIVDIFVAVDKSGNVMQAEIENRLRFNVDSYFKASAIAAQRAIIDCSPLPIPADKYNQLKEFTFGFNPKFISR